jgi:threonine aldolase
MPTAAMRHAMCEAQVGNDRYEEDPTANQLHELAAAMLDKEAALFVPTGTMANALTVRLLLRPTDVVVCEARSAVFIGSHFAGADTDFHLVFAPDGRMPPGAVRNALGNRSSTGQRLLVVENTAMERGGSALDPEHCRELCEVAESVGARTYLDGARVFNAAVALGVPVAELCRPFEAVMFCLAKGLGAPMGAILAGSRAMIAEARRLRMRLGGQIPQVGVMAAAAIVALQEGPAFLSDDHKRAKRLADGIGQCPGLVLNPANVQTNLVFFQVVSDKISGTTLVEGLRERGVLALAYPGSVVRMVTHKEITDADIDATIRALTDAMSPTHAGAG